MAEVVVSVLARDPEAVVRDAGRAAMAGADWIELRLDEWPRGTALAPVLAPIRLPVLVTCRCPRDGGRYRGTARQRRALLEEALEAGARGVDLEDWEDWTPSTTGLRLVLSHHDRKAVPEDPRAIRDALLERGADVAKVVGTARDLAEAAPLVELMASSDPDREPTVAFAMGRAAAPTRILACALGAPLCYGSIAPGEETAPGQLRVEDLVGIYRVRELGPTTEILGLLGDPALHSSGPWVHNRALRRLGIDAVYLPFETSRPREVIAMLPRRRLRGLSVTAPHKETLISVCHRLTPEAQAAGAVNTLLFEAHGQVVGDNTDVAGVREALRRAGLATEPGAHAAVLGGGGAGRAAAIALAEMGFRVTILARTLKRVRDFASRHGFRLASLRPEVLEADPPAVVVHATPLGGEAPKVRDRRPLPGWTPPRGTFVLDMVYRPRQTPLLRDVEAAGAVPVRGIEMFVTQAAEQLARFTGTRPSEDELRRFC